MRDSFGFIIYFGGGKGERAQRSGYAGINEAKSCAADDMHDYIMGGHIPVYAKVYGPDSEWYKLALPDEALGPWTTNPSKWIETAKDQVWGKTDGRHYQ